MPDDEAPDRPPNPPNEDTEGPKIKRARTILACLACRQKKRRCDGERPRCQRCVRTNGTCEYSADFYPVPPAESSLSAKRPIDNERTSSDKIAQPYLPEATEASRHDSNSGLDHFEPFKQMENPRFNPPTSGPRMDDPIGPTFPFNPNEWNRHLVPRASLSHSPGDVNNPYQGNLSGSSNPNVAPFNDRFGFSARQPFPMTEGLPDQRGLDEWTQLFLTQVFTGDGRIPSVPPGSQPPMTLPGHSPFSNTHLGNQPLQPLHSSDQSPNQAFNSKVDAISPQLSNGSSKRGGKYRIPYFRYVWVPHAIHAWLTLLLESRYLYVKQEKVRFRFN